MILFVVGLILVVYFRRKALKYKHDVEKKQISTNAVLTGQEKEKKRVSEELHDNVANELSVLYMQFTAEMIGVPPEIEESISPLLDRLDETVQRVRTISHELYPPELKSFGLVRTIHFYVERYQKANPNINFTYRYPVDIKIEIDENVSLNLLRITQELVSNSVKHSESKNITIDLTLGDEITYQFKDDGKGFDIKKPRLGAGVSNVHLRASSIGAKLVYYSELGKGVFVEVVV